MESKTCYVLVKRAPLNSHVTWIL